MGIERAKVGVWSGNCPVKEKGKIVKWGGKVKITKINVILRSSERAEIFSYVDT